MREILHLCILERFPNLRALSLLFFKFGIMRKVLVDLSNFISPFYYLISSSNLDGEGSFVPFFLQIKKAKILYRTRAWSSSLLVKEME